MIKLFFVMLLFLRPAFTIAQTDTISAVAEKPLTVFKQRVYLEKNGDSFICNKPKTFGFITNIPANTVGYLQHSFKRENLYKVGIVAASTTLLLILDQQITDEFQTFAKSNGIIGSEDFHPIVRVKLFSVPPSSFALLLLK